MNYTEDSIKVLSEDEAAKHSPFGIAHPLSIKYPLMVDWPPESPDSWYHLS